MKLGLALRWSVVVAGTAVIFYFSSRSHLNLGQAAFEGADKLEHAAVFLVWAWTFSWALAATFPGLGKLRGLYLAALAGTLYGAFDELHQRHVLGRTAALADLAADAAGALLGAALHAARRRNSPGVQEQPSPPA